MTKDTAKISYQDGIVYFESSSLITLIMLEYEGKIKAFDATPSDWVMIQRDNKIIILTIQQANNPETLLAYEGDVKFTSMVCYDRDNKKLDTTIKHPKTSIIKETTEIMDALGDPEDYDASFLIGSKQFDNSVIKENLRTNGGEYYYKDGTEYVGEYHKHGSFQAMTGARHSKDAVNIYLKDGKGNIFDPMDKKRMKIINRNIKKAIKK